MNNYMMEGNENMEEDSQNGMMDDELMQEQMEHFEIRKRFGKGAHQKRRGEESYQKNMQAENNLDKTVMKGNTLYFVPKDAAKD